MALVKGTEGKDPVKETKRRNEEKISRRDLWNQASQVTGKVAHGKGCWVV